MGRLNSTLKSLKQKRIYWDLLHCEKASSDISLTGKHVKVTGFFSSSISLGQAARRQADLIASIGFDVQRRDISQLMIPNLNKLQDFDGSKHGSFSRQESGISVFHMNPPEAPKAIRLTADKTKDYRVGQWIFEIPPAPNFWNSVSTLFHEIWTPTQHSAGIIKECSQCPVYVLPLPLTLTPATSQMRSKLSIRDDTFVVLIAYDVNSCIERKNPYAAIKAFKSAFDQDQNVVLLVKTSGLNSFANAKNDLSRAVGNDPRIHVITDIISDEDMAGLVDTADLILSLHRAEGFGFMLADGMARGKPVIATGWSGNMDFMTKENSHIVPYKMITVSDDQGIYSKGEWADPDIDAAIEALRVCYKETEHTQLLGNQAKLDMEKFLKTDAAEKYGKQLNEIFTNFGHSVNG